MSKKSWVSSLFMALFLVFISPQISLAYNFGDYRSATLATKGWDALKANDLEAVLAYTNKCMELYADPAKKMQESLFDYPAGSNEEIFGYWALNDVATSLFIQGEAYRQKGMTEEAKAAYQKIIDQYSYGQCWDEGGWFWKPAEAAQEKIAMIDSGSNLDFGDYASATLTGKAWEALNGNDMAGVDAYTKKCIELYGDKAKEMQASLTEYPWESKEKIFTYWALNDVGTAYFIRGEAFGKAGKKEEARAAYQKVVDEYSYAQCWDPKGWFWKVAEVSKINIEKIKSGKK